MASGEHGGQGHHHPTRSGNRFDRTQLPNTKCRTSKTTFAVCGRAQSCWENVPTCSVRE